jgi:acetyltransferase
LEGGFAGPVLTVNPHETAIRSTLNYRSIDELPLAPDLAIIATPPQTVPGLISDLAKRGCRAAVVITAGFEASGSPLKQQMLDAARPTLMRIVGPNCLGFLSPGRGINASFAHLSPKPGNVAFLTQSGAIAGTMIDWAAASGLGFSHLLSLGDMSDVDFGDLLDYLALDRQTQSILLYVETVTNPRKFMSAARIAARAKPVILVKAGRSRSGAAAALSHTGALAGSDAVYDAAFRRAGLLRVYQLRELFEAADLLATGIRTAGDRLAIVTNGGGLGVLAADAVEERGGRLASVSDQTKAALDKVLPATWSHRNPIDIIGDANGARYDAALKALIDAPDQDAILVMNCPTGVADALEAADAVLARAKAEPRTPILTCWVGEATAAEARRRFSEAHLPTLETPSEAVRAFVHLVEYDKNQKLLMETPPAGVEISAEARERARAIVQTVLAEGRSILTEPEAKGLLATYGIPVVEVLVAKDASEAAEHARKINAPVALKILSPDITHKSDVGGVHLDLHTPEDVERAAVAMLKVVREHVPDAKIEGFAVERMVSRGGAHELIVGMTDDKTFGPVLLFGQGGVAVEVLGDRAMALPPLNSVLAKDLISRTRVSKLLGGYRDVPATDMDALALTLVRLSELVVQVGEIAELDINPLLADENGVLALDARVVVKKTEAPPEARLAIRPYPLELEKDAKLENGHTFHVRPIRPEDAPSLVEMVRRSSPDDVRLRFLGAVKEFPQASAARLSQIDYDREMALVAQELGSDDIVGVVRLIADPNNEEAEFAVMVRSDLKGCGLGYELMTEILAYARARGLARVVGNVLRENVVMLKMSKELGAGVSDLTGEPGVVRVTFDLTRA